ncbi:hypothetical protein CBF34_07650 [Vagococcus penaei]|uniref:non-canonical purine NTP pyrophosphatase n=1 Tax=Vagococcus penaei TaxID=633807 RepID=UPI00098690FD|nr:non-canonical purine NTP pyrophosphatase [Vagococcus penaei]RSU00967.1 hypothetical protein CBF34_07650 [Vagococcus penaei]
MIQLLVASNNLQKIQEMQQLSEMVQFSSYRCMSPEIHVQETGDTFIANAQLKAEKIGSQLNRPVVGDDGGLMLAAFPDLLGVKTARFFVKNSSDSEMNQQILALLQETDNRAFTLNTTLAYYVPQKPLIIIEKNLTGTIAQSERGQAGYGFDTILVPDGYNKTLAELSLQTRQTLSPRIQACQELIKKVKENV